MAPAVSGDGVALFFAVIGRMDVIIRQLDLKRGCSGGGVCLLEMAFSLHQERDFKL